jgi:hypothetical protein
MVIRDVHQQIHACYNDFDDSGGGSGSNKESGSVEGWILVIAQKTCYST